MKNHHLAQVNVAKARAEMDTEIMHGFTSRLDEINALADNAPGFVWRLQTDEGDSTALRIFEEPLLIVNMSVWETLEDLKNYVYKSLHVELIRDRSEWFTKISKPHQALWWVPQGHTPTVEEAKQKLEYITKNGPTKEAFTFGRSF